MMISHLTSSNFCLLKKKPHFFCCWQMFFLVATLWKQATNNPGVFPEPGIGDWNADSSQSWTIWSEADGSPKGMAAHVTPIVSIWGLFIYIYYKDTY